MQEGIREYSKWGESGRIYENNNFFKSPSPIAFFKSSLIQRQSLKMFDSSLAQNG